METNTATDTNGPYTVRSVKGQRTYADLTLDETIEAAKAHDEEYQPAYGTEVADARGDVVWRSDLTGAMYACGQGAHEEPLS